MSMRVSEVWRYPVKSMRGESLQTARFGVDGVEGDRIAQVRDPRGRTVTARTRPALLGHSATLATDGEPRIDGRHWSDPQVARAVEAAAGPGATLTLDDGPERFDVLPLLVATDGAIAALGEDGRRLRPNLVIAGVDGLGERDWEGRLLKVGFAVIHAVNLRQRCVMTTFHPDTLEHDPRVLRKIVRAFGGSMGLNCRVVAPGTISVGDPVELLDAREWDDAGQQGHR